MLYPSVLPNLDRIWSDPDPIAMERKLDYLREPARLSSHNYYLQVLTQIARAQALQGHFAAAHSTLDGVEAELSDGVEEARVRGLIERARILMMQDAAERAEPLLKEALQRTAAYYPHLAQQASQMLNSINEAFAAAA